MTNFLYIFYVIWSLIVAINTDPMVTLQIEKNQGFIAYIKISDGFGMIKNCSVSFNRGKNTENIVIDMNGNNSIQTYSGELVSRYSSKECGIRVENLSSLAQSRRWTIQATDEANYSINHIVVTNVLAANADQAESKISLPIGEETVSCEKNSATKFCRVYDPASGDYSDDCKIKVAVRQDQNLHCRQLSFGRMTDIEETIKIKTSRNAEMAKSSLNETDEYIIMTCQFPNTQKIKHCRAEFPNKRRQLLIQDSLQSGRYSTRHSQIDNGRCVLEIRKPTIQEEKGLWRIYGQESDKIISGCIFHIGERLNLIRKEVEAPETIENIAITSKSTMHDILCEAPFTVSSCSLQSPNNSLKILPAFKMDALSTLGICKFSKVELIAGRWTCIAVGNAPIQTIRKIFQVSYEDSAGTAVTPIVVAARGDSVDLMCRSYKLVPIFRCAFIDPQHTVHVIFNDDSDNYVETTTNERFKYFGQGLNEGHCGLTITAVRQEDFGSWQCHFITSRLTENTASFEILLQQQSISQANVIGLSIGFAFLILIIGVITARYIYKRNILRRCTALRDSNSPSNSSFDIRLSRM